MRLRRLKITIPCAVTLCALMLAGCAGRQAAAIGGSSLPEAHEELNSVLWARTSAEYAASCREIFMLAMLRLDEAAADPTWTALPEQTTDYEGLPPAIILDVDETVLDNSAFEAALIVEGAEYNKPMWDAWISKETAPPIAGSQDFLRLAVDRGVQVFFVTNRDHDTEEHTVRNLRNHFGPSITAEQVLTRKEQPDWTADKTSRRDYVAATHRVLLLVGDDLNDFIQTGDVTAEARLEEAGQFSAYWGTKWIMLPNPMYGSWEQALYGYDRHLDRGDKLRLKREALEASP
jgi:5'-nucleotidase (lipoprotein e(P4) family)